MSQCVRREQGEQGGHLSDKLAQELADLHRYGSGGRQDGRIALGLPPTNYTPIVHRRCNDRPASDDGRIGDRE